MSRHRVWVWAVAGLFGLLVFVAVATVAVVPLTADTVRHRIVESLSTRLDAQVALGDLHWRVFPSIHAEGTDLAIRRRGRTDVKPLISVSRFTVDANLAGLLHKRIAHVVVEGLDVEIGPDDESDDEDRSPNPAGSAPPALETTVYDGAVIDRVDARDARIAIKPREPNKAPKVWAIHVLQLRDVGSAQPMPFDATLTNAIPPGEIATSGSFGPWERRQPGRTPLEGSFTFARADLGVFSGIRGTLAAHGRFGGLIQRIVVNGETDTPDFTVVVGGHPFALHSSYQATVDGTNGNTYLDRIDATFLDSSLTARGKVVDAPPGVHGRIVSLDIAMDRARIEDVMRMAVKTSPPMRGALQLTTTFLLPPGESDVAERLQLDGRFAIARARFLNYDVQNRIDELSHRSRGRKPDDHHDGVLSNFQGQFQLGAGRLKIPHVTFSVPGATVRLAGTYALRRETLDFRGTLGMQAKVSQTQTGLKSLLLKVVDPLFSRPGGGSTIPIRIRGTRADPDFGLDMGRVIRRGDTS